MDASPLAALQQPQFLLAILGSIVIAALSAILIKWLQPSGTHGLNEEGEVVAKSPVEKKPAPAKRGTQARGAHGHAAHHHPHVQYDNCINTIKGHADAVTGLMFARADGLALATACADRTVRVFKLDDVTSKSFKFLRINTNPALIPFCVSFGSTTSQLVVASHGVQGAHLTMYSSPSKPAPSATDSSKLPQPEVQWEQDRIHDTRSLLSLDAAVHSPEDGKAMAVIASCSEGTDAKLWSAADGRLLGAVDSNQLKNHMAALSPNGRFLAIAAFTADVKVWELVYGKDGSFKEVSKVMQLKGHKSAVICLGFTNDERRMVTSSKDGTIKVWNIDVRYHMDEDPKCILTFPCRLPSPKRDGAFYERMAVAPGGRVLAASAGTILQWISVESGEVLETAEQAHEGEITCLAWAPRRISSADGLALVLATGSADRKVKLWRTL